MMNRRVIPQKFTFRSSNFSFVPSALLVVLSLATVAIAQQGAPNPPGAQVREGNRAMDEYDRTINRMKNDAKAANEKRRSLFPQINEDFQRIQVIHNDIVHMLRSNRGLNYDRLAELSDDLKKRTARLRENLALPQIEKSEAETRHPDSIDEAAIDNTIGALHDLIVEFVANPIFKNLGVIDAKMIDTASHNLESIINVSEEIRREAKVLSKSPQK